MEIIIKRTRTTRFGTDGLLYIDTNFVCACAENNLHHIPAGEYRIELRHSKEAYRKVPTLIPLDDGMQVKRGRFPIIKMGNGVHTLRHGQIIVGEPYLSGVVLHSSESFHLLYDRINHALRRGHIVTLEIK